MKIVLILMAILMIAGFVYFNDYQNEMMMMTGAMETKAPDPELDALATELGAVETVFVLITDESQRAFHDAVVANPGKTVHELGVSTEDRLHEIEVPSPDGQTTNRVPALIVFTHEDDIWNEVSFRSDMPIYVLDYVRNVPEVDYIVLNPPPGIGRNVPESMVLDPEEISTLYWRLK